MYPPKEIYIPTARYEFSREPELLDQWSCYRIFEDDVKYIRSDIAELTWYEVANLTAMVSMLNDTDFNGNVFEEALRRFNEQRNK